MSKPFFYRIDAMDFFATVNSFQSEKELVRFVKQFAVDLITREAKTSYSEKVISEAIEYINKKKMAGSKGGKQKASSAKAVLKQCYDFANSKTVANSSTIAVHKDKNLFGEQVAVVPPKKKKEPKPSSEKNEKILYASAYWQWAYQETQGERYYMDWKKDVQLIKQLISSADGYASTVCCWMASYLGDKNRFPKDKSPTIAMLKNQFQQYVNVDCPSYLLPPDGEEWGAWKPWREDDEAEDV